MLQHAIEEQLARDANTGRSRAAVEIVAVDFAYSKDSHNAKGKLALCGTAAQIAGCKFYSYMGQNWTRGGSRYVRYGKFIGYPTDIENAKMIFASLQIQAMRFGMGAPASLGRPHGIPHGVHARVREPHQGARPRGG
jgi:hypothetical protein